MAESSLSPVLQRLVVTLSELGLTGQEIAEAIWLTVRTHEDSAIDVLVRTVPEVVDRPTDDPPTADPPSLIQGSPPELDVETAASPSAEIIPAPPQKTAPLNLPPNYQPIPIPDAPAIPQALHLARALRIFARQFAVGLPTVLDEDATVDRVVETGLWQLVLRSESELWWDVALVFDQSPSMCLWQRLGQDVHRLLARYGEFRDVRLWTLVHPVGDQAGGVRLMNRQGEVCRPKELLVGDRRRLVVIVSDCVAPAWHNGQMQTLIQTWAERLPTVVFQVFPERLWSRTALARSVTVEFQGKQIGLPNHRLKPFARSVWDREALQRSLGRGPLRLPVVSLEPDALAGWAAVVMGDRRSRVLGIVWDGATAGSPGMPLAASRSNATAHWQERIDAFVLTASPISRDLAARLASAPVITLPIARLIQQPMPQASAVHLAEVLMSGLFKVGGAQVPTFENAERVMYELVDDGVRDRLRLGTQVGEAWQVFEQVSGYVARGLGKSVHEFWALLRVPGEGQSSAETEFLQAFARVSAGVLRGLGGNFATIADTLAPAAVADEIAEAEFPWEDLEYEVAKFIDWPELQSCEYESATIEMILDRVEFETATIDRGEWEIKRLVGSNWSYREMLDEAVGLEMMAIPGGRFVMGAPSGEAGSMDSERPLHQVELQSFYLGQHPVTQAQWRIVAGYPEIDRTLDPEPSNFKGDNLPVEQVSWEEAQEFCQRLSVRTGKDYRLPSEAQWEYACRAGTTTPFHFGEMIMTKIANYHGDYTYNNGPKGEYRGQTTAIESFPANDWGLYDMHGNVWEWCEDDWHGNYEGAPDDGSAWLVSDRKISNRLLRSGSWESIPEYCRSAVRDYYPRDLRYGRIGFRVSCVMP